MEGWWFWKHHTEYTTHTNILPNTHTDNMETMPKLFWLIVLYLLPYGGIDHMSSCGNTHVSVCVCVSVFMCLYMHAFCVSVYHATLQSVIFPVCACILSNRERGCCCGHTIFIGSFKIKYSSLPFKITSAASVISSIHIVVLRDELLM